MDEIQNGMSLLEEHKELLDLIDQAESKARSISDKGGPVGQVAQDARPHLKAIQKALRQRIAHYEAQPEAR